MHSPKLWTVGVRPCLSCFFLNNYCEASSPRCCQWSSSPPSGEPGAVCEGKPVLCSSAAQLLGGRRVYSSCGWATETYPSQSERSSFLGFRAPQMHLWAISLDWAGILPLSQLFVPFLEAESLTPPSFHISSWSHDLFCLGSCWDFHPKWKVLEFISFPLDGDSPPLKHCFLCHLNLLDQSRHSAWSLFQTFGLNLDVFTRCRVSFQGDFDHNHTWFPVFLECLLAAACSLTVMENHTSFVCLFVSMASRQPVNGQISKAFYRDAGRAWDTDAAHTKNTPTPTHSTGVKAISVQAKSDFGIKLLSRRNERSEACGRVMAKRKKKKGILCTLVV